VKKPQLVKGFSLNSLSDETGNFKTPAGNHQAMISGNQGARQRHSLIGDLEVEVHDARLTQKALPIELLGSGTGYSSRKRNLSANAMTGDVARLTVRCREIRESLWTLGSRGRINELGTTADKPSLTRGLSRRDETARAAGPKDVAGTDGLQAGLLWPAPRKAGTLSRRRSVRLAP
jgi:hypothetical protein